MFHQSGRLGSDFTDNTQRTLQNTSYLNTLLTDFNSDKVSNNHVNFALENNGLQISGMNGAGAMGVDNESNLLWKTKSQRPLEKLQLFPRPFLTVPYLGRGSCDSTLESQLFQGESVRGKKSVTTVMENDFNPLSKYPLDEGKRQHIQSSVEELALQGWVRGGKATRELEENYFSKNSKPANSGF